ncbi:hypothetical protein Q1695_008319 [Nippostrongylus brasiliensis]|nr:hypothetical protein Q1695_008319 [Nippostrongylus brasiliensis]
MLHPKVSVVELCKRSEESNEPSIPPLTGIIEEFLGVLFRSYAEPQLRASQLQLDKNAEPPWDPDPEF